MNLHERRAGEIADIAVKAFFALPTEPRTRRLVFAASRRLTG